MTETGTQKTNAVTTHSLDSETTPVVAVVSAVAEISGANPFELPPLNNVINAEALNDLVASERHSGLESVSFEYAGYDVVVTGSGDVKVTSTASSSH
ncbi:MULTISPECIES: HalOD1 output domain-containing protein [Natrialbaceae]|uniref:HalOD1 output domain-containing protein n=1 Tax=Natrialbaceae TaxID=1644061 RepID=UPI00207CDADD|nr:HalOD1 output domain-containing protein [Natronococcus sp. CG52]